MKRLKDNTTDLMPFVGSGGTFHQGQGINAYVFFFFARLDTSVDKKEFELLLTMVTDWLFNCK